MEHRGKTVWITGASSGIGRALALRYSSHADRLILSARHLSSLEEVADDAEQPNCEIIVAPIDFCNAEQAAEHAAAIVKQYHAPDTLIHAAGISQKGLVVENALQVYREVMEVNYFGLVGMVKAVLPEMLNAGAGSIVAISSIAGKIGSRTRSGYSASKFAVCGFMDCLRAEVARQGIHCLTVCPGYVKTNIAFNALNPTGSKRASQNPSCGP